MLTIRTSYSCTRECLPAGRQVCSWWALQVERRHVLVEWPWSWWRVRRRRCSATLGGLDWWRRSSAADRRSGCAPLDDHTTDRRSPSLHAPVFHLLAFIHLTRGRSNLTKRPHRRRTWTVQSYSPNGANVHPYLIHASLNPPESTSTMVSRLVLLVDLSKRFFSETFVNLITVYIIFSHPRET